ncbi:MAG: nucleotidyltransferase domain-containing protein [Candidatus Caldarchaeales archaeon]
MEIYGAKALRSIAGLRSLAVFGSVTRGKASADSDVDLLAVLDGLNP